MKEYFLYPIFKVLDILFDRFLPSGLPVLLYHSISDRKTMISVHPEEFDQQMNYLHKNGFSAVSPINLMGLKDWRKKFIITFDDGWRDNLTIAAPILSKYGYFAVVFISSNYIGKQAKFASDPLDKTEYILNKDEINKLENQDCVIANHFLSHKDLAGLSDDELSREYGENKSRLSEIVKNATGLEYVAYPHNIIDGKIKENIKRNGVKMGFGGRRRFYYQGDDQYDIPRIEIFNDTDIKRLKLLLSPSYNFFKKILFK